MSDLRVTMRDEYGRCIHCGFWHPGETAAQLENERFCAEHEAMYRDRGGCGCSFKRLPKPERGKDGKWYAPGFLRVKKIEEAVAPKEPT